MDNAFRDTLMIEMEDLFAEDKVLQQHRAARSRFELILSVGNADTLIGGEMILLVTAFWWNALVGFSSGADSRLIR